MKKSEELYMKHVYTTGGVEDSTEAQEVTINEVESYRPTTRPWKDQNTSEIPPSRGFYEKSSVRGYNKDRTGMIPPEKQSNKEYKMKKEASVYSLYSPVHCSFVHCVVCMSVYMCTVIVVFFLAIEIMNLQYPK